MSIPRVLIPNEQLHDMRQGVTLSATAAQRIVQLSEVNNIFHLTVKPLVVQVLRVCSDADRRPIR